jgi:hypothetical protein
MINPIRAIKNRQLDKFLENDSRNQRPVAMVKESANVYKFVWADEKSQ